MLSLEREDAREEAYDEALEATLLAEEEAWLRAESWVLIAREKRDMTDSVNDGSDGR